MPQHQRRPPRPHEAFQLSEREIWPGCRELDVSGELDLAVSAQLRAALDRAAAAGLHVLVDLSCCDFIDASGVTILVRGDENLSVRGCQLLLFGAGGQVRRVLSVTGLAGANHPLVAADRRPVVAA